MAHLLFTHDLLCRPVMDGWRWVRRRRATVDLFEEIRREYEFGLASISGVARKFGVHRRMVREAIESAIPMRLPAKERPRPTIGPVPGSSTGFWKQIGRRRASSAIRRIASGCGSPVS